MINSRKELVHELWAAGMSKKEILSGVKEVWATHYYPSDLKRDMTGAGKKGTKSNYLSNKATLKQAYKDGEISKSVYSRVLRQRPVNMVLGRYMKAFNPDGKKPKWKQKYLAGLYNLEIGEAPYPEGTP
jgi:hypothetical protein